MEIVLTNLVGAFLGACLISGIANFFIERDQRTFILAMFTMILLFSCVLRLISPYNIHL